MRDRDIELLLTLLSELLALIFRKENNASRFNRDDGLDWLRHNGLILTCNGVGFCHTTPHGQQRPGAYRPWTSAWVFADADFKYNDVPFVNSYCI